MFKRKWILKVRSEVPFDTGWEIPEFGKTLFWTQRGAEKYAKQMNFAARSIGITRIAQEWRAFPR
jgi:hypothetical protein